MFCYKLHRRLLVFESHICLLVCVARMFMSNDGRDQTFYLNFGELQGRIFFLLRNVHGTGLTALTVPLYFFPLRPVRCHLQQYNLVAYEFVQLPCFIAGRFCRFHC